MKAIEKLETLTLKAVHAEVERVRPGVSLVTVYRWRSALRDGRGVSDAVKQTLIAATQELPHPICFGDFAPDSHGAGAT